MVNTMAPSSVQAALFGMMLLAKNLHVNGIEVVSVIPEPNIRGGCTPRCSNTDDVGLYRCDTDINGNSLCNTFELEGEHTCHFHYYTQTEVVQCMAEKHSVEGEAPYTLIVMGSSLLMGGVFATLPWLDYQFETDFDYQTWVFDSPPDPSISQNPMDVCAQMVLDVNGLVDRKAEVNYQAGCMQVYEHSLGGDGSFQGDASIVWSSALSPDMLDLQLDVLADAGRQNDHGDMVIYIGLWYTFCFQGLQWACDAQAEGATLQALSSEPFSVQTEYFETKFTAVVQRIVTDFPNLDLTLSGLRRYSEYTTTFDDVIRQTAATFGLSYLNMDGTANGRPNQPFELDGHPSAMVNHAIFQRLMSSICEGSSIAEPQECEEQVVGSPGCQSETYNDNPDTREWWDQYDRGCIYEAFTSSLTGDTPPPTPTGTSPPATSPPTPEINDPTCPFGAPNVFVNPGVEGSLAPWEFFAAGSVGSITYVSEGGGGARFTINTPGSSDWQMQIYQVLPISELTLGETFTVSFDITADATREITPFIQQFEAPYWPFVSAPCIVGPTVSTCTVSATITTLESPVKFGLQGALSDVDFTMLGGLLCRADGAPTTPAPVPATEAPAPATEAPVSVTEPPVPVTEAPVAPTPSPVPAGRTCSDGSTGVLVNTYFDEGLSGWTGYVRSGSTLVASFVAADGAVTFDIDTRGRRREDMRLYQAVPRADLELGSTYTLSFTLRAESERDVQLLVGLQDSPRSYYARQRVTINSQEAVYTLSTEVFDAGAAILFGVDGGRDDVDFTVEDALLCPGT